MIVAKNVSKSFSDILKERAFLKKIYGPLDSPLLKILVE